ncbi:hypothetical protein FEM41_04085 [Jejubacter calystegiae]|uniref:Uncharacterized protein n=1 Tax=Jejubacter calystegiae TaxID=2579935 RepID=A0A4P8YGF7_9ENTR|nr:hypothetical protein [Jejubacter calystegiae]QCT18886.1 hypothetical protein FEM41_04085 [Jejubacter calystegiae]
MLAHKRYPLISIENNGNFHCIGQLYSPPKSKLPTGGQIMLSIKLPEATENMSSQQLQKLISKFTTSETIRFTLNGSRYQARHTHAQLRLSHQETRDSIKNIVLLDWAVYLFP